MTKFQFAWGDPVCVRQALKEMLRNDPLLHSPHLELIRDGGYPVHEGNPRLIELLKNLALRQSGLRPKHLFVTNGATGGLNSALSVIKDKEEFCITHGTYFPFYPAIISQTGFVHGDESDMEHIESSYYSHKNHVTLIDSPNNPLGHLWYESVDIFDSAYGAYHYRKGSVVPQSWRIMVGSLGKTLGIPGIRIGWVSTNDDDLGIMLARYVTASYAGLPIQSQDTAIWYLGQLHDKMDEFEKLAGNYIDDNRNEFQKVMDHFEQSSVPERGMFCVLEIGDKERRVLESVGVKWQCGTTWGRDKNWARLSLGQNRELTREVVHEILRS